MSISKKIWLLVIIAMTTCAAVSSFGIYGLRLVNSKAVHEMSGMSNEIAQALMAYKV